MSITIKSPSNRVEGDPSRARGPAGDTIRLTGTPPFGGAVHTSRRTSALLSRGRRVFFDGGAACGCGIGAIGSGPTLGADRPDAAPYDRESSEPNAMPVLPNAAGACEPEAGLEGFGPVSQGHDDESSGCVGAGRREGEESMKDSGDRQGSVEYRHGTLGTEAEGLLEELKALSRRVDDGFKRQRQETENLSREARRDLKEQNRKIDDGFERQRQEVERDRKERRQKQLQKSEKKRDKRIQKVDRRIEKRRQESRDYYNRLVGVLQVTGGVFLVFIVVKAAKIIWS